MYIVVNIGIYHNYTEAYIIAYFYYIHYFIERGVVAMVKQFSLVTIEAILVVENQDINVVLEDFDGNVKSDGLHIVNKRGLRLSCTCVDLSIIEVVQGEGDDEDVLYSDKPTATYYNSTNQSFSYKDIIVIDNHEYVVVKNKDEVFLFSSTRLEKGLVPTIHFSDIKKVEQLKDQLLNVYPDYKVLRRIN